MKNLIKSSQQRKALITLISIILVLSLTVGTSFAIKAAQNAGEVTNVFTFAEDIRARLTEPNWDPDEGLKIVPGKTISKDPMITNTCDRDEYVAIKVTFQYKDKATTMSNEDYQRLRNAMSIAYKTLGDGSTWTFVKDSDEQPVFICVYSARVQPGQVTKPLFSSIRFKNKLDGLKESEMRWLQGIKIVDGEIVEDSTGLGSFNIKIEGAAVLASEFESVGSAYSTLINLFS